MFTKSIVVAAMLSASMYSMIASAEDAQPASRASIKESTRNAEKAGQLTPPGQGPAILVPRTTDKTRSQRKAETLQAERDGELLPAGPAADLKRDRGIQGARSTVDRSARKADTRAAEKAGTLIPAGEGPGAPRK